MTALELDLPINPVPLARARVVEDRRTGRMRSHNTPKVEAFYEEFRWWARTRGRVRNPLLGDLALEILLWRRCTSPTNRGDLSNLVKAIEDAGNPSRDGGWCGLWHDDRQIVAYEHVRIVDSGPGVQGRILLRIHRWHAENGVR